MLNSDKTDKILWLTLFKVSVPFHFHVEYDLPTYYAIHNFEICMIKVKTKNKENLYVYEILGNTYFVNIS